MATLSFKGSVEAFAKKAGLGMDTAVRRTVFELLVGVVGATPVDTGRARSNWQVTSGAPAESSINDITDGDGVIQRERTNINSLVAGTPAFVTNNVAYILALEFGQYPDPPKRGSYLKKGQEKGPFIGSGYFQFSEGGFSSQAPEGMARVTVQRVRANFNATLGIGAEGDTFTMRAVTP